MTAQFSGRAPTHFWVVGIVSLLWNAFGAYDYLMSALDPAAYFAGAGYGPEVTAWFEAFPAWAVAAWAVGVWASVVGSILLLLRSRFAASAFLLSLVGAVISFVFQFTSDRPAEIATASDALMPVVILIAIAAQGYYARQMTTKGVLR